MTTELIMLAWGCVLAFVHIMAAAQAKTRQYGSKWNIGARDEDLPPPNPIVGRLSRAQANFFETFPIMVAAVLIVSAANLGNATTALGAMIWLGARVAYLPLYALGVPVIRSVAWIAATVGIVMILWPALQAAF
ncbi:MAG TPA: MAPEG family protein [Allosphingosinicella sp.]|nr:MAPEG family protein [Allosphingosinicella sp.]